MRFKVVLRLNLNVSGNVMPISYQYDLCRAVRWFLTSDASAYKNWLDANDLTEQEAEEVSLYSLSNLYVPHLHVFNDRMTIQVPKIQFWISFQHDKETQEFLNYALLNKSFDLGDRKSFVNFTVESVTPTAPVAFMNIMSYQTISPVSVIALRENNTIEYLDPENPVFMQFVFEELVERWEHIHKTTYTGSQQYRFKLLAPPKRKAVTVGADKRARKMISYMIKFELTMDPKLQEIAYNLGIGNEIQSGFGYIEMLNKS